MRFLFTQRAKNWDLKEKFSNAKPKPKVADPTRVTKICPKPITTFD